MKHTLSYRSPFLTGLRPSAPLRNYSQNGGKHGGLHNAVTVRRMLRLRGFSLIFDTCRDIWVCVFASSRWAIFVSQKHVYSCLLLVPVTETCTDIIFYIGYYRLMYKSQGMPHEGSILISYTTVYDAIFAYSTTVSPAHLFIRSPLTLKHISKVS